MDSPSPFQKKKSYQKFANHYYRPTPNVHGSREALVKKRESESGRQSPDTTWNDLDCTTPSSSSKKPRATSTPVSTPVQSHPGSARSVTATSTSGAGKKRKFNECRTTDRIKHLNLNLALDEDLGAELPVLSPVDKKLVDKIAVLKRYMEDFENMNHASDSMATSETVEKLKAAIDSIKAQRETLAIKQTAEKYQELYNNAVKEQAEIGWRIQVLEGCQDSNCEAIQKEKQALLSEYLDIIDQRNTIVQLQHELEKLMEA